jgi:hypothetical protein
LADSLDRRCSRAFAVRSLDALPALLKSVALDLLPPSTEMQRGRAD